MGQFAGGYTGKKSQAVAIARPQQSERSRSWQMSAGLFVIFGSLILGACVSFYRQTRAEMTMAVMRKQQEAARVNNLEIEIARTQEEIQKAKTDRRVIESLVRENLGFVKQGEVVIRNKNLQTGVRGTDDPRQ